MRLFPLHACAALFTVCLISWQAALALDSCVVPHGATYNINEHSTCRAVTNNVAAGEAIMVPTKTADE
jgi:hypothetical protein